MSLFPNRKKHDIHSASQHTSVTTWRGVAMIPSIMRMRLSALCVLVCISSPLYSQSQIQVGYTLLTADPGTSVPVGSALFSFTNPQGILVSQAGVAAAEPILSGRIFVDETGTQTGIALVNPSQQEASVTLILRNASGTEVNRITRTLSAGRHLAIFVFQLFKNLPASFTGSLTFESNQKLAAIALRQSSNALGEPLYTTLPVVDLAVPAGNEPLVFPHIAAGSGYTTQVLLINTTSQRLTGRISLIAPEGTPLPLLVNGVFNSQFSYQIDPHGTFRADFDSPSGLATGYALLSPVPPGAAAPAGSAVFQFKKNGSFVTEAGVAAANPTSSARIFVDEVGSSTGVAVANPADQPTTLTFILLDRYGSPLDSTIRTLPARGQIAIFAWQLFPGMPKQFTGLIEINSPSPVVSITLKLTENARSDQVLTTLPVADLSRPPTAASVVFAHVAIGEGFTTRLIFINADKTRAVGAKLSFFNSDATPMTVPLGSKIDSQFSCQIAAGGGRQFFPGNAARVANITLLDPSSNQAAKEVVVNEGQSMCLTLLVLDETGLPRDDFDLYYSSLSTDIATVDGTGNIQGKKAGFSTLTISAGNVISAGTITVVAVNSGVAGYEITGVAQDLASRLYLANSADHTILRAQDVSQAPEIYAGVSKTAGLKNDTRLQSLFKNPAFIAFNQAQGALFVSDSGNNAVRVVQPGPAGTVSTLVGGLNNPRGVALDYRGNLWVADSGSQTIRRINLASAAVETIAGQPGSSGWLDGKGANARFSSPAGIALETEPLAAQLERERKGLPVPPVAVLVADTGNGVIRRVKETGDVETIGTGSSSSLSLRLAAAAPTSFSAPAGIAVDPLGSIYVSEPGTGRVKVILRTGEVVSAAQAGTFVAPTGIAIGQGGRIVVAERNRAVRQIRYGEPQITIVTPNRVSSKGGTRVTIKGRNFAPDTLVVVSGVWISTPDISDTQTVSFIAPPLPSGRGILTVQNRAGLAQTQLMVDAVPLGELPQGYITTIAGGSTFGGEGSAATAVALSPWGVVADAAGNVLIAEAINHRVRKVDSKTGTITTIAGSGQMGSSGDNGPAIAASLSFPNSLSFDATGNLYVADAPQIRKIDASTGIISTVAGAQLGYCGDDGRAVDACFQNHVGVVADSVGNLFIADDVNHRVRRVDVKTGMITTIAGSGQEGFSGDGRPAKSAALDHPVAVAIDEARNILYIADSFNDRLRKVDLTTNVMTTVAGGGSPADGLGDNLPATSARLVGPQGIALDSAGNIFIADTFQNRIRKVDIATGIIVTVAGRGFAGYSGDGGLATDALVDLPMGIAADAAGNLLIADLANNVLRKVDTNGIITTLAGSGQLSMLDDDTLATAATLWPTGVAFDADGNLWITDYGNGRIRKVDATTKIITSPVGTSTSDLGDGGPASEAGLSGPQGAIVFDRDGNLYLADTFHYRVRRVDARTKIITTVAGNGVPTVLNGGSLGDGGPATAASLNEPSALALDTQGNLYILDEGNHRIRKVNLAAGTIDSVKGIGNGGAAPETILGYFTSIAIDASGDLLIGQVMDGPYGGRVLRVDAVSHMITTVAGGGSSNEENIPAIAALMNAGGIVVDNAGNLFIIDRILDSIRRVDAITHKIVTVAGSGDRDIFSGDNGPALRAALSYPLGIALDGAGNLFIAEAGNGRIRAVRGPF